MTAVARADQIKAIHTLKSRAGLPEEDYRAALAREGVDTSKKLTPAQADAFIERLRGFSNFRAPQKPRVSGALNLSGPFAGKLRALWIAAYDCGIIRDRTDKALVAFLERQTGLSHPAFLHEPSDARKAVEALKKWLAREAHIDWTVKPYDNADVMQRLAVIRAQVAMIGEPLAGDDRALCLRAYDRRQQPTSDDHQQLLRDLDALRSRLGHELRARKETRT